MDRFYRPLLVAGSIVQGILVLAFLWLAIQCLPVLWEIIHPSANSTTRRIWEYEAREERERQEKKSHAESESKKKREKIKNKE